MKIYSTDYRVIWTAIILILSTSVYASPPEISGNYEQGQRYTAPNEEYFWDNYSEEYDENEEDIMYFFKKGSFQLKQDVFKSLCYSIIEMTEKTMAYSNVGKIQDEFNS